MIAAMVMSAVCLGAEPPTKTLEKEALVQAAPEALWEAWATRDGLKKLIVDDAKVELRPGGAYEWYFSMQAPEGSRGSEGCTVLSFIPGRMIAFTWNAPPQIDDLRKSHALTQVVVTFEPVFDQTRVRLTQTGFGEGPSWDKYHTYFDRAWGIVLQRLQEQFKGARASRPATKPTTLVDGEVAIRYVRGKDAWQEFTLTLAADPAKVWKTLATTEGMQSMGAKEALVELKPGGKYAFWPGATNRVLAFAPGRMLSVSGSAPPEFPNVRKGGTWGAYFLEPVEKTHTRLRLLTAGWKDDDAEYHKAFDYFLKNNPVFLKALAKSLGGAISPPTTLKNEAVINAPPSQVWKAYTTGDALAHWMSNLADVDFKVGGRIRTNYNAKGKLDDATAIEHTILSFDPERMFSMRTVKCPTGFPFAKELSQVWWVTYFEPTSDGKTRLTMIGHGFGVDEASQKMRGHFEQGNAATFDKLKKYVEGGTVAAK